MKLWTNWIRKQDEEKCGGRRLWLCGFHFADWLALDNPVQGESFGGTDPYYVASAYYYFSALTTAKAAKVLGMQADYEEYSTLAEEIRTAFRKEFFTATGRIAEPTQTAMLLSLSLDLVPDEHRERICRDLRAKIAARKDHLDTGFVGTYHLCPTLTKNGMADVAYTLLLNEDFPSWLYEVNMGATTVWERWNSVLPNGLVSDTGMNSMNHYAYGAIVEWMYRFMCGLNPVEDCPGFKRAVIRPYTDERFDYARAKYDSAAGLYECGWKREDGAVIYDITIPFDCEAEFIPETNEGEWTIDGKKMDGSITLRTGTYQIIRR
jgi:alpha-L-rhamnosidase